MSVPKTLPKSFCRHIRNISRVQGLFQNKEIEGRKCCPKPLCELQVESSLEIVDPVSFDGACDLPRVLVIGAGMAGLSAACQLISRGFYNVMLLEASDRIGGRLLTSWMGDSVIELGANTIDGGSLVNPVFNIANMEGLFRNGVTRRTDYDKNYITLDSRLIPSHYVEELLFNDFVELARNAYKTIGQDVSILDFLSVRIQQELLNFPAHMRYDSEKLLFSMVADLKSKIGCELGKVSTANFAVNEPLPGGEVRLPQGFCSVLATFQRIIPEGCVQLNKEVTLIEWSSRCKLPQVCVYCADGTTYCCNYVIVTLPLGVLKNKLEDLFCPRLPEVKVKAIKELGVAHVNRVYLEYINPWWVHKEGNLRIAWSPSELAEWPTWTKGISTIEEVANSTRVLMFDIGGLEALELEQSSEIEIAIEFTSFIRKVFSNKTIPYPNNIAVSRWASNPYSGGAKVFLPTSATIGHINNLYEPTAYPIPAILIAGDATHEKYYGTLHGARISGIREAERILKFIQFQNESLRPKTLLQKVKDFFRK